VFAFGAKSIYRVLLQGSEFTLLVEGTGPIIGFFTSRFIAARNSEEASEKAKTSVLQEWRRQGFDASTGTMPQVRVEYAEATDMQFRLRSGGGFTFYGSEDDV
jgi:hypothetical protein